MSPDGKFQAIIYNEPIIFNSSNLLTKDSVNNILFQIIYTKDGENWSIINIPNIYNVI